MNVRSRIISINLIEKIKLQPEYAERIGIDLRIQKRDGIQNINEGGTNVGKENNK